MIFLTIFERFFKNKEKRLPLLQKNWKK